MPQQAQRNHAVSPASRTNKADFMAKANMFNKPASQSNAQQAQRNHAISPASRTNKADFMAKANMFNKPASQSNAQQAQRNHAISPASRTNKADFMAKANMFNKPASQGNAQQAQRNHAVSPASRTNKADFMTKANMFNKQVQKDTVSQRLVHKTEMTKLNELAPNADLNDKKRQLEGEEDVISRASEPRSVSPIQHARNQQDTGDTPVSVAPSHNSAARPSGQMESEVSRNRTNLSAKHHASKMPAPVLQQPTAGMPPSLPSQQILGVPPPLPTHGMNIPPPLPSQPIARVPPPLPTQGMIVPLPLPTSINTNASSANHPAPIAMGGLLAEIRAGKALKKVAQTRKASSKNVRKKAGGGGGIMAQMLQRQREMKAKQRQKKGGRRFTGIGEDTVDTVQNNLGRRSLKQKKCTATIEAAEFKRSWSTNTTKKIRHPGGRYCKKTRCHFFLAQEVTIICRLCHEDCQDRCQ